ncbi:ComEC/Rec2 family competence protein [Roseibium sp. CAU 1637]|uniref:ComEC/Rec2 family competence protein n=1 Tax=Roseibium limicola TaxID=2816037 RepID=A0A939EL85_9HYPH|nr:ComEC/Rec2 family competence protein [Roseibium limicola]MBO0344518.1 ComEC/Rec2 family competence protein [Roseibium limicola]
MAPRRDKDGLQPEDRAGDDGQSAALLDSPRGRETAPDRPWLKWRVFLRPPRNTPKPNGHGEVDDPEVEDLYAPAQEASAKRGLLSRCLRVIKPETRDGQGLLWAGFCFAAGIGLYFQLPEEPHRISLLLLWGLLVLGGVWRAWRHRSGGHSFNTPYLVFVLMLTGVVCASVRTASVSAPRLSLPVTADFTATVLERQNTPRGLRLVLRVEELFDREGKVIAPEDIRSPRLKPLPGLKVRMSVNGTGETSGASQASAASGAQRRAILPGDHLRLRGRLFPPRGPVHPGGYDFSFWAYFSSLGASGFSFGAPKVLSATPLSPKARLVRGLSALRLSLGGRVRALGGEGQATQLAMALLVGDRSGLDAHTEELLRHSGLAHILAISGLHMALFAGGAYGAVLLAMAFSGTASLVLPSHKIAALAGLAMAVLYLAVSGASVPTQRSFLMVGLVLLARLTDRRGLTLHSVALAGCGLLFVAPERLFSPGFQMSFAAVICLIAVYEGWRGWSLRLGSEAGAAGGSGASVSGAGVAGPASYLWRGGRLMAGFLLGVLVTSLVAGVATGVIAAHHFGRFAPYGLLGNLLAMPVFSLIVMPLGGVALILLPFGLAAVPLAGMTAGLELLLRIAEFVSGLSARALPAGGPAGDQVGGLVETFGLLSGAIRPPGPVSMLGLTAGLFVLLLFKGWSRCWGLVLVAVGMLLHQGARPPDLQINSDGTVIAFRDAVGHLVTSARRRSFQTETWAVVEGKAGTFRPVPGDLRRCDAAGCVFSLHSVARPERSLPQGKVWNDSRSLTLALSKTYEAAALDCALADIVVSGLRLPASCSAPLVLDGNTLTARGAQAIWFSARPQWGYRLLADPRVSRSHSVGRTWQPRSHALAEDPHSSIDRYDFIVRDNQEFESFLGDDFVFSGHSEESLLEATDTIAARVAAQVAPVGPADPGAIIDTGTWLPSAPVVDRSPLYIRVDSALPALHRPWTPGYSDR